MAIAVDSRSSGARSSTTPSWSHTVSGSDRILVVGVSIIGASAASVTGVTFGAAALTQFGTVLATNPNGSGNVEMRTYLFYKIAPATGTDTITVSCSFTGAGIAQCGSISLTGVHQTTPWNAAGPHTQNIYNSQPTVTITSAADEWAIACFSSVTTPDPTPSVGGGETTVSDWFDGSPLFMQHLLADEDSSGGSTTVSYTGLTLNAGDSLRVTFTGNSAAIDTNGAISVFVVGYPIPNYDEKDAVKHPSFYR